MTRPTWFVRLPASVHAGTALQHAQTLLAAAVSLGDLGALIDLPGQSVRATLQELASIPTIRALAPERTLRVRLAEDEAALLALLWERRLIEAFWRSRPTARRAAEPMPVERAAPALDQPYLQTKPRGLGVGRRLARDPAWGEEVQLAVVERGWDVRHEDLRAFDALREPSRRDIAHGTRTLGVLAMNPTNVLGGQGLVPAARITISPPYDRYGKDEPDERTTADAISAAATQTEGGVLLVEEQAYADSEKIRLGPIEMFAPCACAIAWAVYKRGWVVVEPGGNFEMSLDTWKDETGARRLDPRNQKFADTGGVVVGGARWKGGGWRDDHTAFGRRVNCVGPSDTVPSTEPGGGYGAGFDGTSSASALIAGLAGLVVSHAIQHSIPWTPDLIRRLFSCRKLFPPLENGANQSCAGVPDLPTLLAALENGLPPDCR